MTSLRRCRCLSRSKLKPTAIDATKGRDHDMQILIWVTFLGMSGPVNAAAWPSNEQPRVFDSWDACSSELPSLRAGFNRSSFAKVNRVQGVVKVDCVRAAELPSGWHKM